MVLSGLLKSFTQLHDINFYPTQFFLTRYKENDIKS